MKLLSWTAFEVEIKLTLGLVVKVIKKLLRHIYKFR